MALIIRPLTAQDLSEAGRIIRLALAPSWEHPEPEQFWADMDYAPHPLARRSHGSLRCGIDGELVGSNFATRWGV